MQILWCPFDAHGAEKEIDVRLVWRNSASIHEPLSMAPQLKVVGRAGYVPEPCLVDPKEILEHQAFELLPEDLQESLEGREDWEDEDAPHYRYNLSVAPGWKAGGFASWHLTGRREMLCDCGAPMRLLITVDSKEWDNGSLSWRPIEDSGNLGLRVEQTDAGSGWKGRVIAYFRMHLGRLAYPQDQRTVNPRHTPCSSSTEQHVCCRHARRLHTFGCWDHHGRRFL